MRLEKNHNVVRIFKFNFTFCVPNLPIAMVNCAISYPDLNSKIKFVEILSIIICQNYISSKVEFYIQKFWGGSAYSKVFWTLSEKSSQTSPSGLQPSQVQVFTRHFLNFFFIFSKTRIMGEQLFQYVFSVSFPMSAETLTWKKKKRKEKKQSKTRIVQIYFTKLPEVQKGWIQNKF